MNLRVLYKIFMTRQNYFGGHPKTSAGVPERTWHTTWIKDFEILEAVDELTFSPELPVVESNQR
jgi:hypothetical protein